MKKSDLEPFFRKYGPAVYRRARYLLGNTADAEEATQEVFLRALRSASGFEGRSQVYTWLCRITTNYCFNFMRDKRRREALWGDHLERRPSLPTDNLSASEKIEILRCLLAHADESMTEPAQAALYVYVDGMSQSEAGEMLGVSRSSIGKYLEKFNLWAREFLDGGSQPGSSRV